MTKRGTFRANLLFMYILNTRDLGEFGEVEYFSVLSDLDDEGGESTTLKLLAHSL
jgi:hypothetical protein